MLVCCPLLSLPSPASLMPPARVCAPFRFLQDQALLQEALAFYRWGAGRGEEGLAALGCPVPTTSVDSALQPATQPAVTPPFLHACARHPPARSLSAAYQLRLASPTAATGGPPTLPLPEPPQKEICVLPVGAVGGVCSGADRGGEAGCCWGCCCPPPTHSPAFGCQSAAGGHPLDRPPTPPPAGVLHGGRGGAAAAGGAREVSKAQGARRRGVPPVVPSRHAPRVLTDALAASRSRRLRRSRCTLQPASQPGMLVRTTHTAWNACTYVQPARCVRRPDLVEASRMDDFMLYFTVFLGAPSCVKNAFLR